MASRSCVFVMQGMLRLSLEVIVMDRWGHNSGSSTPGIGGRMANLERLSRIVTDAVDFGCAPSTSGGITSVVDTISVSAARTKSKADIYRYLHAYFGGQEGFQ